MKATNNNDIYLIFEHMDSDLHKIIQKKILKQVHKKYILYQILIIWLNFCRLSLLGYSDYPFLNIFSNNRITSNMKLIFSGVGTSRGKLELYRFMRKTTGSYDLRGAPLT